MIIGVKYCGGCNVTFNRKLFVKNLMKRFSNIIFEPAVERKNYHIVLIVCGCLSACANCTNLTSAHKITVVSEYDYIKTVEKIKHYSIN